MYRVASQVGLIVAIAVAASNANIVPGGTEPTGNSQPLVIVIEDHELPEGSNFLHIMVSNGVATNLGCVTTVGPDGKPRTSPDDPEEPEEPEDPPEEPGSTLADVRMNMATVGKLQLFDQQLSALRLSLNVPNAVTTRAAAYNAVVGGVTVIIGDDQTSWVPWFQPLIKSLEAEQNLEQFKTLVNAARIEIEEFRSRS